VDSAVWRDVHIDFVPQMQRLDLRCLFVQTEVGNVVTRILNEFHQLTPLRNILAEP
jgi:hypothetical protein